jgi:hypothetical protein
MSELLHGGSWAGGWDEPGVQGIVIIGAGLPGEGLFVYDTVSPAINHLIYSIVPASGTDTVGNTVLGGATSYSVQAGTYYAINLSQSGFPPRVTWYVSGSDQTGTYTVMYGLYDAVSAAVHGLSLNNVPFVNPPGAWSAPLLPSDPAGANAGVTETWHSLGTLANYTVTTGRYRLTALGETEFDVLVASSGANAGSTAFSTTISAAYRPTVGNKAYPMVSSRVLTAGDTQPHLTVATNGVVSVVQTASITATLDGHGIFVPLD